MKSSMPCIDTTSHVSSLLGEANNPISSPMCSHPFFGIDAGWDGSPNLHFKMSSLYECIQPTSFAKDETPPMPHLKIFMSTARDMKNLNKVISQGELGILMCAFYNRVYQPGYENCEIFPVSLL